MDQFVLSVPDLEKGLSHRRYNLAGSWLSEQLSDCDGITAMGPAGHAELDITRRGREVVLRGRVTVVLAVRCVRCLDDYEFPVSAEVDVLMQPDKDGASCQAGENDGDDLDNLGVERYQGDQIVLDDLVRDVILLEVPMNPNCGDGCPGWGHLVAG